MSKPNITIPTSFGGVKADFDNNHLTNGFPQLTPDVLPGDCLNKFIDDTYKGLNGVLELFEGCVLYDATVTYTNKSLVFDITNNNISLYRSLQNGNIGHPLTDTDYWEEVKLGGGSGLEVCDIGMALYVDETKGLRRYLNGQIVDINANTQAFLNRLLKIKDTNPDYFTTEDNWQAEALLNIDGCVYKFVLNYDSTGTNVVSVRLPKYPDYVEVSADGTATQIPVKTNQTSFGNNAGALAVPANNSNITYYVKSQDGSGNVFVNSDRGSSVRWYADISKSQIVKRTKLKLRYFIQIATGSETENNIINEIELNNPFSLFDSKYSDHELNNLSWLKSEGQWNAKTVYTTAYNKLLKVQNGTETVEGLSVKLSAEEYTDYDFVLNTAEETFRLPLKNHTADDGNSVLTLYYYVGETVQNANLIDAGRIGEQLATKTDVDGSNMVNSVKNFDGGWVNFNSPVTLSTATAVGTYTLDLSSYLPDDNYNYEVKILFYCYKSGDSEYHYGFYNDIFPEVSEDDSWGYINANVRSNTMCFDMPVSTQRYIIYKITQNAAGNVYVRAVGYRRMGTNQ